MAATIPPFTASKQGSTVDVGGVGTKGWRRWWRRSAKLSAAATEYLVPHHEAAASSLAGRLGANRCASAGLEFAWRRNWAPGTRKRFATAVDAALKLCRSGSKTSINGRGYAV